MPPCGGHPRRCRAQLWTQQVSSRAPVWGASGSNSLHDLLKNGFKSCPRVGGIVRGSRRCQWPVAGFKSCPRVGGIVCHSGANAARSVSSRAPVWGASIPFG